jgi:hypothetical protein
VTVSVLQSLARLPDGGQGVPLDLDELGRYLSTSLNTDAEKKRNQRHALRDRLYRDGGDEDMRLVVDAYFENDEVRRKRKAVIPHAKFSNDLKHIVGMLSTVYAEPARRFVGNAADQARFDELVKSLCLDEQMDVINQMLNLHRALIVGPRIRVNADETREMVLDMVTPSGARALCNPLDRTQVLGWLVKVDMPLVRNPWGKKPEWVLWTDHERVYLDETLNPIGATYTEHGLGLSRWVPLSYSATAIPGFWPGEEGEDLVAARMAIWLAAILMIKETKSNRKQPVLSGDATTMAREQAADSDVAIEAPEGVSVTTIDVGTDPQIFITAADHILERCGNNYGLSRSAMRHDMQSADAREAMMEPVRERRRKQTKIMRRFEARLAVVMARVAEVDAPDLAFNPDGFRVNFGEPKVVMGEKERLELYEHRRRLGLADPVSFRMSEDPDIDEEGAWDELAEHTENNLKHQIMQRPLQALNGADGAPDPANPQAGVPQGPVDERADVEEDPYAWVSEVANAA